MAKQPAEPGGVPESAAPRRDNDDQLARVLRRPLPRRDFLRVAAAGGAYAGLSAFLAACGTAATPTPSTGPSASAGPVITPGATPGRTIKVGYVSPKTGPLAGFAEADDYILGDLAATLASKVVIGGVTHPIEVIVKDTQSSPDTAAQVAGSLILDDAIDLMLVASTPETVNPVASTCEANGVPCISSVAPWQPYYVGRQTPGAAPEEWDPFDWTYHFFWGLEDVISTFLDMWGQIDTNKKVGGLFPNDGDGNAWGDTALGFPPPLGEAGYALTDPGRYENLAQDFTAQINAYKTAGVEILTGVPIPPDFTNFYKQAIQQGFKPKAASIGKALLFPSSVEALGDLGEGLSSEVWWSPTHPFASSLTGASAQELADGYTAATSRQWTQPIGFAHALFEVAIDALNRSGNVDDKGALRDAIKATTLDTIVGKVDWTANTPVPNVSKTPLVGGQWRMSTGGTFMYDLVIVSNKDHPEIPSSGTTLQPIA